MLKIEGKTFMNIQEAVQWLLDNNALPFQCTANYQANTEIGLGTIENPTPAKVRIGSLIFFADSKVSTVVGITDTGFICSDKYNNLVDDIAYVTNVAINASGHLITTLSDGQTIDAGIVKQVSGFSINGSQHLIANYNDGTSTDLGAIFSGNITVSGNLTVTGSINGIATPSLKPIYYHPIYVLGTYGGQDCRFTFVILDNNSTAYNAITGIAKLKELLDLGAIIQVNGYIPYSSRNYNLFMIIKSGEHYYFFSNSESSIYNNFELDDITIQAFTDGVNKIN